MPRLALTLALLATALTIACTVGDSDVPLSCQPGEIGTCKGPSGCAGTAVCNDAGLDFGPCQCTSDAGAD